MGIFNMKQGNHHKHPAADGHKAPPATGTEQAAKPAEHLAASASEHPPKADHIQTELALSKALVEDLTNQVKRVQAEFENYIKRQAREMQDLSKYAKKDVLKNIVIIFDDFERALQTEHKGDEFQKGIELVYKEFKKILTTEGVKPIDALGQPFNPDYHDVLMVESDDDKEEQTVIGEFQKGYLLHDKVLRPTKVKLSKHSEEKTNGKK